MEKRNLEVKTQSSTMQSIAKNKKSNQTEFCPLMDKLLFETMLFLNHRPRCACLKYPALTHCCGMPPDTNLHTVKISSWNLYYYIEQKPFSSILKK